MPRRQLVLNPTERQALVQMRDHARQPYLRERAAALLKIADGMPAALVARQGLLRPRRPDTVYEWLDRYQATGSAGMKVHLGRGRKPAFSPSASDGGGGPHGIAAPLPTGSAGLRSGVDPLDPGGSPAGVCVAGRLDAGRGAYRAAACPHRVEAGPGRHPQSRPGL